MGETGTSHLLRITQTSQYLEMCVSVYETRGRQQMVLLSGQLSGFQQKYFESINGTWMLKYVPLNNQAICNYSARDTKHCYRERLSTILKLVMHGLDSDQHKFQTLK